MDELCIRRILKESNKELKENIKDKKYIVLLGDIPDDVTMVSKEKLNHTITIGFLEENIESNLEKYNKTFDIVLANNASFKDVLKLIDFNKKIVKDKIKIF